MPLCTDGQENLDAPVRCATVALQLMEISNNTMKARIRATRTALTRLPTSASDYVCRPMHTCMACIHVYTCASLCIMFAPACLINVSTVYIRHRV